MGTNISILRIFNQHYYYYTCDKMRLHSKNCLMSDDEKGLLGKAHLLARVKFL